jgi:hypothetical protein
LMTAGKTPKPESGDPKFKETLSALRLIALVAYFALRRAADGILAAFAQRTGTEASRFAAEVVRCH